MPPQTPQSLLMEGRPVEALPLFDAALAANPRDAQLLFGRATALKLLGRLDEACAGYDAVLALAPGALGALNNRGEVLLGLGQVGAALADFEQTLAIQRDYPPAILGRSMALVRLGRAAEALPGLGQVLALMPDHTDAWFHRGVALDQLGYPEDAVTSYDKVLAQRPTATAALANRGNSLHRLRRLDEAMACFAAVEKLLPGHGVALNGQAAIAAHICDWSRHGEFEKAVVAAIRAGSADIHPGTLLAYSNEPDVMLANARAHAVPASGPAWMAQPFSGSKIKLAYCSADFHAHPTARLMAGLFEQHDRQRFEVIAISFGPDDGSALRARLKAAFDQFHDVRTSSDAAVADLMVSLGVDIAIDLMGVTQYSRPGLFACRPAPVQVSYIGFPGTLGTACHDYILADAVVAPPQHQPFYSETIIALPDSYQANDDRRPGAGAVPSRAQAGLPEHGFIFCSFNNNWKINPAQFALWMRLLQAMPDSVLWLLRDAPEAAANLKTQAAAHGIAPQRLVFAPRVAAEHHLARFRLADLFLDTQPCGAHTTASDALWCGVPVVTCLGEGFPGRVAASLLTAIGLPELITDNAADYESLALALATDAPRLAALKAKIAANRKTTALFDTARFTKNIEAAFEKMRDGFLKK
jgi:predicted O-linked N-acetylglucosamine transferase (SPINDLY family)